MPAPCTASPHRRLVRPSSRREREESGPSRRSIRFRPAHRRVAASRRAVVSHRRRGRDRRGRRCWAAGRRKGLGIRAAGRPLRAALHVPHAALARTARTRRRTRRRAAPGVRGSSNRPRTTGCPSALRRCCDRLQPDASRSRASPSATTSDSCWCRRARSSRRLSNPLDHLARLSGKRVAVQLVADPRRLARAKHPRRPAGPAVLHRLRPHRLRADGVRLPQVRGLPLARELRRLAARRAARGVQPRPRRCACWRISARADPARHFPSPYARRDGRFGRSQSGRRLFRQCLATLRSAARPHVVDPGGRDYFLPLALYTGLMLRWCDPSRTDDESQQRRLARQGVVHALASASLVDGVLGK